MQHFLLIEVIEPNLGKLFGRGASGVEVAWGVADDQTTTSSNVIEMLPAHTAAHKVLMHDKNISEHLCLSNKPHSNRNARSEHTLHSY